MCENRLKPTEAVIMGPCSNKDAITDVHTDCSGMAVHVRIILGEKLWYVATNSLPLPGQDGYKKEDLHWQCLILRPHDDL